MAFEKTGFALMLALTLSAPSFAQDESWEHGELSWRAQHEKELQGPPPYGWLSLVGGYRLPPRKMSLGSAKDNQIVIPAAPLHLATLRLRAGIIALLAPAQGFPVGFNINGQPAKEGVLNAVDESEPPSVMSYKSLTLYAVLEDTAYSLYVFDTTAAARHHFPGLNWYPLDRRYRITARWEPFSRPVTKTITTSLSRTKRIQVPGQVEFSWKGIIYRLEPDQIAADALAFTIHDLTNGQATYGGGRFLTTAYPSHGLHHPGELQLDFNQLRNPPCVFSAYANCPLAPEQNQLPFPLEAGELKFHE
jgi:uncharacterized protein (DUF1684 family)